jgi:hypothetical protein
VSCDVRRMNAWLVEQQFVVTGVGSDAMQQAVESLKRHGMMATAEGDSLIIRVQVDSLNEGEAKTRAVEIVDKTLDSVGYEMGGASKLGESRHVAELLSLCGSIFGIPGTTSVAYGRLREAPWWQVATPVAAAHASKSSFVRLPAVTLTHLCGPMDETARSVNAACR